MKSKNRLGEFITIFCLVVATFFSCEIKPNEVEAKPNLIELEYKAYTTGGKFLTSGFRFRISTHPENSALSCFFVDSSTAITCYPNGTN